MPYATGPIAAVAYAMLATLSVALLMAFYRLVRGPSLPDRVMALDVAATLLVGMMGLYAVAKSEPVFIRVAMVVALVNFFGTIAYAYYLTQRGAE